MTASVVPPMVNERRVAARRGTRSRFHLAVSGALLAMVFAAFAPTFYLRAQFGASPLPFYLSVHGAVLTAWFVCLVAQSTLMAGGHAIVHRRLGIAATGLAAAVVATGATVTWRFVPRLAALGVDIDAALPQLSAIVWGDAGLLAAFTVLFSAAVLLRRRPDAHKRLVLLASINLMPPALARIAQWPLFGFGGVHQVLFALGGLLLLVAVVVAHDAASSRRVHPATLCGASVVLLLAVGALAFGGSDLARTFVRGLG